MKVLLLYPALPLTFFSFPKLIRRLGCKAVMPPLGLLTVAALLPQEWQLRLVDLNVEPVTDQHWNWADLVMISGMFIQRHNLLPLVREAKSRGKTVAVGGPYPTSLPEEVLDAGADFVIRGEGEITVPLFLQALAQGRQGGVITSDTRPDVTTSPIPRFDLANLKNYFALPMQTSRGCPHNCEFCDVVQLFGRRPRYKEPRQVIAELEAMLRLGWRGSVYVGDDNFIGNKTRARALLRELIPWSKSRGEPFVFSTQATVKLGLDVPMIDLMTEANFVEVCLGLETLDEEALIRSAKHHNRFIALQEAVKNIQANGLSITGSFILGMDGESPGAGDRIISFVEATNIPIALINPMQPPPRTRLWQRLQQEDRLVEAEFRAFKAIDMLEISTFFIPSRPREQILAEYHQTWETLYEPKRYLKRCYQYFLGMRPTRTELARRQGKKLPPLPMAPPKKPWARKWREFLLVLSVLWSLGVVSTARWQFWRQLRGMIRNNPSRLEGYFISCINGEGLFWLRDILLKRLSGN